MPGAWPRPDAARSPRCRRRPADPRRRGRAARRPGRVDGPGGAGAAGRAGCGWSCWCTCRWATRGGRPTPGRGRARCSSAAAAGRHDQRLDPAARCCELYALPDDRVHVAEPGVDAADLAPGTPDGGALLCVAAVIPAQGPRRAARGARDDRPTCPGSASAWAASTATRRSRSGSAAAPATAASADRVSFPGPRTGADLDRSYAAADLLVLASRARDVRHGRDRGAGPRPAGRRGRGRRRAGGARARRRRDAPRAARAARRRRRALAAALRAWLGDAGAAASACAGPPASGARRSPGWSATTSVVADVLAGAAR